MVRTDILRSSILAAVLLMAPAAHAADPVYTGWFSDVAAGGYDVVAYFTRQEAVEGASEHAHQWRGAEWHFASEAHLQRFREDPERYAPAYGGHCALAAAEGAAEAGDPEIWTIHDGRLYFNYNQSVQERWDADREGHIAAADREWPEVVD